MDAHDTPSLYQRAGQSLHVDAMSAEDSTSPLDSPETPASALQRRKASTTSLSSLPPPSDDFSLPNASPTSGPQRTSTSRPGTATSTRSSGSKDGLDSVKRKRSRVTPEQLQHLERLFAQDRSPTAAKRKEISEMLGMQERQTQIWFQNRRAKAKNQDGKGKLGRGSGSPPDTPPDHMTSQYDLARLTLVHEEAPVSFLPCDDLTIGNWRRIANASQRTDLLAYACDAKRCLAWYIQSSGFGFKMEIPYEIITRINVSGLPARPDMAFVSFFLSGAPAFFLENIVPSPNAPGGVVKSWVHCQDWTEGAQASNVGKHEVVGPYLPMVAALRSLPISSRISGLDALPIRLDPINPPMQLPPPPLAGLQTSSAMGMSFPFTDGGMHEAPMPHLMGRRRSLSGPTSSSHVMQHPPYSASSDAMPSFMHQGPRPSSMQYGAATYQQQLEQPIFRFAPPGLAHPSPPHEYGSAPLPQFSSQVTDGSGVIIDSSIYDDSFHSSMSGNLGLMDTSSQHATPFFGSDAMSVSSASPHGHSMFPAPSRGSLSERSSNSSLDGALGLSSMSQSSHGSHSSHGYSSDGRPTTSPANQ